MSPAASAAAQVGAVAPVARATAPAPIVGGSIYESRHNLKLACIVGGTPVEFPNDIWVTNTSSATLIKGMALTFAIPSVGVKGSFILPSNVAPGTQVKIADVFGGAEAGAPCTIKVA